MRASAVKDFEAFGRTVKLARLRKNLTREKLGKLCGVTEGMIGKIERGIAGPKTETLKQLEKALGISINKFLDMGKGGVVMEGLQELTDQVRLLTGKIEAMEKERSPVNPVLPDASEAKGDKAQIITVVKNQGDKLNDHDSRIAKLEDGIKFEDEPDEKETPDQIIKALLTEHEDLKKEGIFKDFDGGLFGESIEQQRFKAQLYVDICNACDKLELDAFEKVKGGIFTSDANRAEAIRDIIIDFCTDDITKAEASEELEKYFKLANPFDDEDQDIFD